MTSIDRLAAAVTPARLVAATVMIVLGGAALYAFGPHATLAAEGWATTLPESQPFGSAVAIEAWIESLSVSGRAAYTQFQWMDALHGPLLPLLCAAIALRHAGSLRGLAVFGVLGAASEWIENAALLASLEGVSGATAVASITTSVKLSAISIALLIALGTLVAGVARAVARRRQVCAEPTATS